MRKIGELKNGPEGKIPAELYWSTTTDPDDVAILNQAVDEIMRTKQVSETDARLEAPSYIEKTLKAGENNSTP